MAGIGGGQNKFVNCINCKDRTIEPNCHMTCRGYLYRKKKAEELKETIGKEKSKGLTHNVKGLQ